jgi:endonuclease/exonuclease/phosphatase family metal-dependent hydrolase
MYEEKLPEYARLLGPMAGNKTPHEFNAIFFDPTRLEVLDSGGFWLSTTPDRYSSSWQARSVRSVNWADLRCLNTGLSFLHLNTHLDHVSRLARVEGSRLILRKIAEIRKGQANDSPTVLTGDFNCAPGSLPHRNFAEDGFVDTCLAIGNGSVEGAHTFHAFKGPRYLAESNCHVSGRIDWILVKDPRQRIRMESHLIVRNCDEETGIYPSDHYPVLAELALPAGNGKINGRKDRGDDSRTSIGSP